MSRIHTDLSLVSVTVAPSPASSGTTIGVSDASAALLPDTYPWWGVIKPAGIAPTRANAEVVKVTAGSSNAGTTTYTIVRAQGIPVTSARTVTVGDDFYEANSVEGLLNGAVNGENLLKNGNFINNSTNGYGGTPDDWSTYNLTSCIQGGFPAFTKQNLIDLLGVSDGDIEGLWNLNEASGNATDLSSNNYTLTDSNTVLSSDLGLMGKARDFEKDSTEYLTIANASCPNLEIAGSQTWFCFFKPESIGFHQSLMGKAPSGAAAYIRLHVPSSNAVAFNTTGLTTNVNIDSDVKVEAGKWYMAVAVYDSANTKLKIWVNGIKKEVTASGSQTDTNGDFSIGRFGGDNSNYFDGLIQCAGVLSVALTDDQVKRLFAATLYRGVKIIGTTGAPQLYQALPQNFLEQYRGKTVTLTAKIAQSADSIGKLQLYDGKTATLSDTFTGTNTYQEVSVTKTIASDATILQASIITSTSATEACWFKEVHVTESSISLPYEHSKDDWSRFPRLLRMDIPAVINGYSFEEGKFFNWTTTLTGMSSVTNVTGRFCISGNKCTITPSASGQFNGTSNATGFTFSLPVKNSVNSYQYAIPVFVQDNGSIVAAPGNVEIANGAVTASVWKTWYQGTWTASGNKVLNFCQISYEID